MSPSASGPAETSVHLGVVLAPELPVDAVDADALRVRLDAAFPGLRWSVHLRREALGDADADALDLLELVRDRMLDEDWDVVVGLLDRPLVQGHHTRTEQVSPVHAAAVVSLDHAAEPAEEATARVVGWILGLDPDDDAPSATDRAGAVRWARQLADDVEERRGESGVAYAARVAGSNARLILGAVRANRPWTVALTLTRSMSTALATGALTLITTDLWLLAAEYNGVQMALLGIAAVGAVTVSLMIGAHLWERPRRSGEREQVTVFNIATLLTVLLGVVTLHVLLMIAALAGAALLVDADVFAEVTGEAATWVEYLKLAWFVGGLATIGSALGAGLEDDDDVRDAVFTRGSGH
ncbi:hypothetical protein JSY14_06660 [Brachybacterium sp. EF45031]|uniref:hypothetical protein n=1 Tax=Brachybacterium sillae TaxID=2810536 RepID=UPI00217CD907|nr:hypothetical protein [Brachybacterium sillae]MCS6711716.1 hypothetical protein [Brachybacterium sillae]